MSDRTAFEVDEGAEEDVIARYYVRAGDKLTEGQVAIVEDDPAHPDGQARIVKGDPRFGYGEVGDTPLVSRKCATGELVKITSGEQRKFDAARSKYETADAERLTKERADADGARAALRTAAPDDRESVDPDQFKRMGAALTAAQAHASETEKRAQAAEEMAAGLEIRLQTLEAAFMDASGGGPSDVPQTDPNANPSTANPNDPPNPPSGRGSRSGS